LLMHTQNQFEFLPQISESLQKFCCPKQSEQEQDSLLVQIQLLLQLRSSQLLFHELLFDHELLFEEQNSRQIQSEHILVFNQHLFCRQTQNQSEFLLQNNQS